MRDEMTRAGAVHAVQAIAAILLAFSESSLDQGDPATAMRWLGFALDEAGGVLAAEMREIRR